MSTTKITMACLFVAMLLMACMAATPAANAWDAELHHTNMAEYTCKHMGITGQYLEETKQGSVDADKYDVLPSYNNIEPILMAIHYSMVKDPSIFEPINGTMNKSYAVANTAYHSLMHSYLVDVDMLDTPTQPVSTICELSDMNAPHFAVLKAEEARTSYRNGQYDKAYEQLGYAMHYVQDLAHPGHVTLMGLAPCDTIYEDGGSIPPYKTFHGAMEAYPFYNWESITHGTDPRRVLFGYSNTESFYFNRALEQKSDPYQIEDENDVEDDAKALACLSYLSSLYIQDEINRDPEYWMFDPGVRESIEWLMVEQDKTNMGLVDYVTRPADT